MSTLPSVEELKDVKMHWQKQNNSIKVRKIEDCIRVQEDENKQKTVTNKQKKRKTSEINKQAIRQRRAIIGMEKEKREKRNKQNKKRVDKKRKASEVTKEEGTMIIYRSTRKRRLESLKEIEKQQGKV